MVKLLASRMVQGIDISEETGTGIMDIIIRFHSSAFMSYDFE
jgi:hypothetical protein